MNTVFNVNEINPLIEKVFMKAAEDYRESGGSMRDVLKGDMKTKVREFNVNTVNTRQISRKWLLEMLNEKEQKMYKAFVSSVNK